MQVRSQNLITDKHFPREVLIGLNKRNPQALPHLPCANAFSDYCELTRHQGGISYNASMNLAALLQLFDMYRIKLDATSAEPELAASNPGDVLAWLTDADFQIRGSAVRLLLMQEQLVFSQHELPAVPA